MPGPFPLRTPRPEFGNVSQRIPLGLTDMQTPGFNQALKTPFQTNHQATQKPVVEVEKPKTEPDYIPGAPMNVQYDHPAFIPDPWGGEETLARIRSILHDDDSDARVPGPDDEDTKQFERDTEELYREALVVSRGRHQ
ncbi:hypothetical protein J8273_3664 [Carpediemonas membranifera]|uniref:Uncharacterized protein n=1 Tax=Carpediemonas membranifera TaxID=201153 RepID=A0A8J6BCP4_9EUKA|nr:hypothetical protein J8273_3664 [Carpediemonas membranifera]|eukprot:KAG9394692.1 hypothetical protein J8273_3664 [Carpediemonas membranifera]